MTTQANQLLKAALQLSEEERETMIQHLMDSLKGDAPAEVDDSWRREVSRRVKEMKDGTATMVPWDQARRQIAGDSHGANA